jgi:hypothetical protein
MQTSSLSQIRKELEHLSDADLQSLCLRLTRFKKENKELLHYLLFEAQDESSYVQSLKEAFLAEWRTVNRHNLYLAKKSIRRILKLSKKHIRFSDKKETEIELLLFFCQQMKQSDIDFAESKVLVNIYNAQLKSIQKALSSLHEDLQYDYQEQVNRLIV